MMKMIKRVLLITLSFWCCFYYNIDGEIVLVRGNPRHFEGWYDEETGKEQQIIWMEDGREYTVDTDDLTMIYYDDGFSVG